MKTTSELIDTSYREYSMYVLEQRAIPSCIDGLKTVTRKTIFAAIDKGGRSKKIKIADLGGSLSSYGYVHGEASAQGAAVDLAKEWDNNAPLLQGFGNFGSRLVPEAAAPRYIYAMLHKNFDKFFIDHEVAPVSEDVENPEPKHYLPLIPWVLVNGVRGIAIGFATLILPRNPNDLIDACKKILSGTKLDNSTVIPSFPGFKGSVVENGHPLSWKAIGIVSKEGTFGYRITEVPPGVSRESYVSFLNDLCDEGKIRDFEDYCDESGFNFLVKISKDQDQKISPDPIAFFKLSKSFTENLTTLDENGKLKIFSSVEDLISYFVQYRISKSQEKINFELDELKRKSDFLEQKYNFINMVLEQNGIILSAAKKSDVISFIKKRVLKDGNDDTTLKKLIGLSIYEFNEESLTEIENTITMIHKEIKELEKINGKDRYKSRLSSLKG